ncbi:MAG: hypothetical protein LBK67_09795, partial [Coriobacteriales bacterium]|nr:hypothetical protein [Coriobacteriales bacterium]
MGKALAQMGTMEDSRESKNRRSLLNDLATLWPGIPYLGLGVWLSWAFFAYSGIFWLSDTEAGGNTLATMYLFSTGSNAIVLLITPLFSRQFERILSSHTCVLGAGVLTALGSSGIILAGPYYFALPQLFLVGSIATGVGTAIITLRCGQLYSGLQPWKALIYTLLSQLVIVIIFFFLLGNENFRVGGGRPPRRGGGARGGGGGGAGRAGR